MHVALIARELHWSRAEILALPVAEFNAYVALLVDSLTPKPPT
jgi:hypothetical protein